MEEELGSPTLQSRAPDELAVIMRLWIYTNTSLENLGVGPIMRTVWPLGQYGRGDLGCGNELS
jgi:hypothetical protein